MRLTEALTKVLYQRAIDTNKTAELAKAFDRHLGLKDRFRQVQASGSDKKVWKKLSLKGYECYPFSKSLAAAGTLPAESAIERVVREVWPCQVSAQQPDPVERPHVRRKAVTGQGKGKGKQAPAPISVPAKPGSDQPEEARFVELSCRLWRKFHVVTKQLRSKDPQDASLRDFGKNCRDLGARWCMFLPRNRCSALYLHTVMMHGGAFMTYLLRRNLTIGMLENSGAERRHQIGKVQFRKSLGGGGTLYFAMSGTEARSAYLTLRGLLIWQYGRDLLAYLLAEEQRKAQNDAAAEGGRRRMGWESIRENTTLVQKRLSQLQYHGCETLDASDMLTDELLEQLEATDDSSAPVDLVAATGLEVQVSEGTSNSNCSGYINPDQPIVLSDGSHIADLDGGGLDRLDGSDVESGPNGSESSSDLGESCSEDDGDSGADTPDDEC